MLIVLNGVAQTPDTAFEVQGDSIVFAEPPQPPASVKYVNIGISQVATKTLRFPPNSGIFPSIGNTLVGVSSTARLTVTSIAGETITGFVTQGTFILNEQCQVSATGFSGALLEITDVTSNGLFGFNETVTNLSGDTAIVESINLETGQKLLLLNCVIVLVLLQQILKLFQQHHLLMLRPRRNIYYRRKLSNR